MGTATTDARARRIAQIDQLAADAFKHHVATRVHGVGLYRSWRCSRDGTGIYAFSVTTVPGRLIVSGDIGFLAVERTEDMIPWCRGSIESIAYFAEKVPPCIHTREFDGDVAIEWLQEQLADEDAEWLPTQRTTLQTALAWVESGECGEESLLRELHDADVIDESPDFANWTRNFLWCRAALRWLLERIPEPVEAVPPAGETSWTN